MMRSKKSRIALAVPTLVVLLGAAACGGDPSDEGEGSGVGLEVVAGFYPLAEAATRVGGDRVTVTNMTPAGTEPHDLELSTRQVDTIEDADVVLYLGEGFQPELEKLVGRLDGVAVDLLEGQELLEGGEDDHGDEEGSEEDDDHGDEGEDEDHADEEEGEEHSSADPHVWLDPQRMQGIVERIVDAFVDADADGEDVYRENAEAYVEELAALDGDMEEGLATCERDVIVTSHSAFGYLAERFGLTQESIAGLSPESEPDPRRLAELADEVAEEGITTIFYETLVAPDVAETLAREAKVKTAVLNPLEGLTDDEVASGETYESVMRANLAALRDALGCT